jgi:hypothetical protein
LLSAPAQIQVIDTPQDPRQALHSRLKILFAGLFGAVAVACAFGLLAEQLDDRLRGTVMLKSVTGLPVTATFSPGAFSKTVPRALPPPASAPA